MAFTTKIKQYLNSILNPLNMQIDSCTAERLEAQRIGYLQQKEYFEKKLFDIPMLGNYDPNLLLHAIQSYNHAFNHFLGESLDDVSYSFQNIYYTHPDAEVLYTMIRNLKPKRVIEIGSGNSTKLIRQAVTDGSLSTRIISIDPHPRVSIAKIADQIFDITLEEFYFSHSNYFYSLEANDILFIDSSHQIKTGNDVVFIYNMIIPQLPAGVIIHAHDIYLPFDYPLSIVRKKWNYTEHYLLHALLQNHNQYEILWPGYYLYKTWADFDDYFPFNKSHLPALSFWIRKLA